MMTAPKGPRSVTRIPERGLSFQELCEGERATREARAVSLLSRTLARNSPSDVKGPCLRVRSPLPPQRPDHNPEQE